MKTVTGTEQLSKIVLQGFMSIFDCEIELGKLNVLIGCNGAGKSNFFGFFRMIQQVLENNLQLYVSKQGGPDALLHFGRKKTKSIKTELYFRNNGYQCTLEPTADNRMIIANESFWQDISGSRKIASGHFESLAQKDAYTKIDQHVLTALKQWRVYHFDDTGASAPVKQIHGINDNAYLRPDAENLAAYLYLLKQKHNNHYQRIVKTIRLAAPFFGDFNLRPTPYNKDMIELEWVEKGQDAPFKAHRLSDGTLRFACLTTLFHQPSEKQTETILVDEPELGLHPYAIKVLASLMKSASKQNQVIVSTQSVELLDEFDPEDVIVVDRKEGQSVFRRQKEEELHKWLEDYSLGELWKKNILGGRPAR